MKRITLVQQTKPTKDLRRALESINHNRFGNQLILRADYTAECGRCWEGVAYVLDPDSQNPVLCFPRPFGADGILMILEAVSDRKAMKHAFHVPVEFIGHTVDEDPMDAGIPDPCPKCGSRNTDCGC